MSATTRIDETHTRVWRLYDSDGEEVRCETTAVGGSDKVQHGSLDLTPTEARDLATILVAAADCAEGK
ncbi:MAG: hypothetical protein AAGF31_08805 [Planctomycetota bacterium]